jgi:hypothetical protein
MAGGSLSGREGRVGVALAREGFALEGFARDDFALGDRAFEVFAREVFAREALALDVFFLAAFFAGDAFFAEDRPDFFGPRFIVLRARDFPFFLAAMATLLPVIWKAACSRVAAGSPRSIYPYSV